MYMSCARWLTRCSNVRVNMQNHSPKSAPKKSVAVEEPPTLPLYRRAKRDLQKIIETGNFGTGKPLPGEATLAAALGVSVGTLRHAVDELVQEHVLVRRQGRGTFVAPHNRARFMFQFFNVAPRWYPEEDDGEATQMAEFPEIVCLGFLKDQATAAEASALRMRSQEAVYRIENKLSLRGRVVMHDRIVVSAAQFRDLTVARFVERPSTIYALYQMDFGITVLRAHERARATLATRPVSQVLGIAPGAPVLEVHRLALSFGDKPVEYRISTINTQVHDYVSALSKKT